ncbi:MAG: hypothetical protein JWO08_1523 [Verrucomicrobiaceae bacterium]|nr:hypothetical protein [Verrucomicrobiaceae bacterium]
MNALRSLLRLVACSVMIGTSFSLAADKMRVVSPSKVDAAKLRVRDKAASEWMTEPDLKKNNEAMAAENKQLVYFEYHVGKDKWRAIYSDKIKFSGFSWWVFYGGNEMEAKVNVEMSKGLEPAFVVRSGNSYAMLFVRPEQMEDIKKILDEYGVGQPRLKK